MAKQTFKTDISVFCYVFQFSTLRIKFKKSLEMIASLSISLTETKKRQTDYFQ